MADGYQRRPEEKGLTTLSLRFRFQPTPEVDALLGKCWTMAREAVSWALENGKTATHTIVGECYHAFRERFPELHSVWVTKSARTAAAIVHAFRRRRRRGKEPKEKPTLRRAWVYVDKRVFRFSWDGTWLEVRIAIRPKDTSPITLRFRPHGKYRRLVEAWARGECTLGEPTLSRTTLIIPLKFPTLTIYEPREVCGIDSNERSLDLHGQRGVEKTFAFSLDTSYVPQVNADHDRRIQRGCRGKQNPKAKAKMIRKHSSRRRNRTQEFWHLVALQMIWMALGIDAVLVLEQLKGLKGRIAGSASKRMRRRLLNQWSIRTLHAFLRHKAEVYGVPLLEVNPRGTSSTCPVCGDDLRGQEELGCPSCGLSMDRHLLAAWNIALRGQRKLPLGGTGESADGLARFAKHQSPLWGQGVMGAPRRPLPDQVGVLPAWTQREAQATA